MPWEQLLAIADEAATYAREDRDPPTACPNDGEPLIEHRGVLHCRFDGYVWPEDAR